MILMIKINENIQWKSNLKIPEKVPTDDVCVTDYDRFAFLGGFR